MSHKKYRTETNCLNCGAEVTGKFCSQCGQENLETKERFLPMVGHFISDYLHFDSKFFRSFVPLFLKPGFLTQQYWDGKRVLYIHPLRIFFFVTVVFVVCAGVFYKKYNTELKKSFHEDPTLAKLDSVYRDAPDTTRVFVNKSMGTLTVKDIHKERTQDVRRLNKLKSGLDDVFKSLKYVAFLLLPIYALIFKLLYIRRKSYYVDHLIYSMHIQVFAYTILTIAFFLPLLLNSSLRVMMNIAMAMILIYIAISLRYLYQQAWWKTILKSLISVFAIFFSTAVIMMMIALVDAMFIQ